MARESEDDVSVVVLSPHRDDAAFSCGLLLAKLVEMGVAVMIVNVFTISDYAPYVEVETGRERSEEVTRLRADEDDAFLRELQGDCVDGQADVALVDLGWKDAPLRHAMATEDVLAGVVDPAEDSARLREAFRALGAASIVLAPLALGGHLDHRVVRDAAVRVWPEAGILFYEDLPYACRMSAEKRAEETMGAVTWDCEGVYGPVGSSGMKARFARCYGSQIADAVADEMEEYGAAMGWRERYFGSADARRAFAKVMREEGRGR